MAYSFAQTQDQTGNEDDSPKNLQDLIAIQLLTQVGPITAAIIGLGIDYLRRRGMQISGEAEEYFVNSISSLAANQSRWIYKEIRDNKKVWVDKDREKGITDERDFPKSLGEQAFKNVLGQLSEMLRSNEFTSNAKQILSKNVEHLIETAVTKNNKELTERGRNLICSIAPLAIDSLLLPIRTKSEAKEKQKEILDNAMKAIQKSFDFEQIQFDKNFAELFIKARLYQRINEVEK
ncbi:MAG: hypothetical protein HYS80_01460 [Candidatus Aenigmarchaeota archaeon]|nr:hypothetical protein [Candidatus Aenigmarchaeota archaeon]